MSRRLLPLLAVALTACGLLGPDVDTLVAAGTRTTEAGTARVAFTTVVDGGVGRPKQRTDATGLVDFGRNLTQLEMRVGRPGSAGAERSADGLVTVVVRDDESVYLRPASASGDRPWGRIAIDPVEGRAALPAGDDLGGQLQLLGGGVTDLRELGEEDVRGEPATRYRVTVDLARAVESAPEQDRDALRALAERAGEQDFLLDVWVGDGHVRRMSYTVPLDAEGTLSTVVEYFDFGVPVEVAIPDNAIDLCDSDPLDLGG